MNKQAFLADPDVEDFLRWLTRKLPRLKVRLDIKRSRFVPSGVNVEVTGLENVLPHYTWKSHGMASGDWAETRMHLAALADALRDAVQRDSDPDALAACGEILRWGGNRGWHRGAYPFFSARAAAGVLCRYLRDTGAAFALDTADVGTLVPQVEQLNSMLTKVHALYATDGLPIYDSRVAATIATLVEMWRVATGKSGDPLPAPLTFPATAASRTVCDRFPHASSPVVMAYGAPETTGQWASAKVRLGWVMESILGRLPELFADCCPAPNLADRMHAFEASLFMVGYDIGRIDYTRCGWSQPGSKSHTRHRHQVGGLWGGSPLRRFKD